MAIVNTSLASSRKNLRKDSFRFGKSQEGLSRLVIFAALLLIIRSKRVRFATGQVPKSETWLISSLECALEPSKREQRCGVDQ
jgi:hypothetical protein